jgi:dipeptidyl aminopeptidase/acylaminoacyl peptidase
VPSLYAWTADSKNARVIYRVDGTLGSCEIADGHAICLHEAPTTPRRIVSIRLSDGKLTTVFDPNPGFKHFRLGAVEKLEWKDAFGNETFGHLVYPPDYHAGRRYPMVIVQYRSRGFLKGGVGNEYPIFPLAAKGFIVLSFDRPEDAKIAAAYVASNLHEQGVSEAPLWKGAYSRRQALTALEIIIDRLAKRGLIDPEKIGISGLSDGAANVDFALFNSTRFAAAAESGDWSPIAYMMMPNPAMRDFFRAMLSANSGPVAVVERWKALSMAFHADRVVTPLLMQISDRELIDDLPNYVALKDAGKPVDAYVFPDEYHFKWQPQHKLAVAERAIDWFCFWLKNEETGDPTKARQYEAWRQLKERTTRPTSSPK